MPCYNALVFNILRFTALRYTAYKHAQLQCPGLHQPILHNRLCQPRNYQKALQHTQLTQPVCTLTALQVEDTRCLIHTHVQLMMKMDKMQPVNSEDNYIKNLSPFMEYVQ